VPERIAAPETAKPETRKTDIVSTWRITSLTASHQANRAGHSRRWGWWWRGAAGACGHRSAGGKAAAGWQRLGFDLDLVGAGDQGIGNIPAVRLPGARGE